MKLKAICDNEETARLILYRYFGGYGTLLVHKEDTSKTEVWVIDAKKK